MRSHIELAYSSIRVFADDGKIDISELNFLLGIALKDNQVTDDEKRVLNNIFSRVDSSNASELVLDRIAEVKAKYSL